MGIKIDRTDTESLKVLSAIETEDDPRAALAALKKRISYFEELGKAVPEALLTAQHQLIVELAAQSQGR